MAHLTFLGHCKYRQSAEAEHKRAKIERAKRVKELELKLQGAAINLEAAKKAFSGAVIAVREAEKGVER